MVKGGEQYFDSVKIPSNRFDRTDARPRMIATPALTTLGLPQAVTSTVTAAVKRVVPEFISGLNLKELAQEFQNRLDLD